MDCMEPPVVTPALNMADAEDEVEDNVDDVSETGAENMEIEAAGNNDMSSVTESAFEDVHKNLASLSQSQLDNYESSEAPIGSEDSSDESDITEIPMNHSQQSLKEQSSELKNTLTDDNACDQNDNHQEQISMNLEGANQSVSEETDNILVSTDANTGTHPLSDDSDGAELENGEDHGVSEQEDTGTSIGHDHEYAETAMESTEQIESESAKNKLHEHEEDASDIDTSDIAGDNESLAEMTDEYFENSFSSANISPSGLALHQSPSRRGRGRKRRWSSGRGRGRGRGRGWTNAKRKRFLGTFPQPLTDTSVGVGSLDQSDQDVDLDSSGDMAAVTPESGGVDSADRSIERVRRQPRTPQFKESYYIGDKLIDEELKKSRSLLIDHGQKATGTMLGKKSLSEEELALYRQPFNEGWRREVVLRGVHDDDLLGKKNKQMADVYYFPPTGPKLRSMVQVSDWLSKCMSTSLTGRNFTFMRQTIGVEEGEVVRHASASRGRGSPRAQLEGSRKRLVPTRPSGFNSNISLGGPHVVIERDSDDFVSPIITQRLNSDDRFGRPALKMKIISPRKRGRPPKIVVQQRPPDSVIKSLTDELKVKHDPGVKVKEENVELSQPSKEEIIVFPHGPMMRKLKSTARKSTTQKVFRQSVPSSGGMENLCSVSCPGMGGVAPMLYCSMCMCLFHNECVNYFGPDSEFICLRCVSRDKSADEPSVGGCDLLKGSPGSVMTVSMPVQLLGLESKPIHMMSAGSPQASMSATARTPPQPHMFIKSIVTTNPEVSSQPITVLKTYTSSSPRESPNNKSPFAEIRPAASIKQEPIDEAYDSANSRTKQASTQALGNLKNVISSRLSSSSLANQLSKPVQDFRKTHSTPVTSVSATRAYSQTLLSNAINSLNRLATPANHGINTLPNAPNSGGLRFVSIGPGIPITNMTIPMQGLQGTSLIPISNVGTQLSGNQTNSSSLFNWPSVQQNKTPVRSANMPSLTVAPAGPSLLTTAGPLTSPVNGSSVVGPVVVNAKHLGAPMNGQLLTLPAAVVKRLSLTKPLALKINNKQINVPPSGFFQTSEGLKVFLPPDTFPAGEDLDGSNYSVKTTESKSLLTDKPSEASHKADVPARRPEPMPQIESVKGAVPVDVNKSKYKDYFTRCPMQKLSSGFDCMLQIFEYLNVKDLVRVGMVCKSWRRISQQPSLWEHISFAGMKVEDWARMLQLLKKHSIQSVSLLGLVQWDDMAKTWHGLTDCLQELPDLRHLTFGQVPAAILDLVCRQLPSVCSVDAEHITNMTDESKWLVPTPLDVGQFKTLTNLRELRLRGLGGLVLPAFSLAGGLEQLGTLTNLEVLSILSFKNMKQDSFTFISRLPKLQDLAIGDCTDWTAATYQELGRCAGIRKLHLEKGGSIPDVGFGEALIKLQHLEKLELHSFKVPVTFESHLSMIYKLKHLVIQPDNTSLSAEMNSNTLAAVQGLSNLRTLKWLVSGQDCNAIILDDADTGDSNQNTPTMQQKWIPFLTDDQTEYTGLDQLKEKLSVSLPSTRVSVLSLKSADIT